jgi:beta-lactamase class A
MRRSAIALVVFAVFAALAAAGTAPAAAAGRAAGARTAAARAKPRARPRARSARPARAASVRRVPAASAQQRLTAAVGPLVRADGGHVAVAVDDLTTGARAAYGGTAQFDTASIVKVDILATLLYQLQRAGQALTPQEQELATTMIENSDDDSASDLYYQVNGSQGIGDANRVFGLRQTTVGTDDYWGLTTTTVDDQIRLLRQVLTRPSALSPASQDYIRGLMSHVETDQRWGVPAAADPGTQFMVKNGWLPNPSLWEINSIGEIVHDRQHMLIAVLSDDNASEYSGIAVVEDVAAKAADSVAAGDETMIPRSAVASRPRSPAARRLTLAGWPLSGGPVYGAGSWAAAWHDGGHALSGEGKALFHRG